MGKNRAQILEMCVEKGILGVEHLDLGEHSVGVFHPGQANCLLGLFECLLLSPDDFTGGL